MQKTDGNEPENVQKDKKGTLTTQSRISIMKKEKRNSIHAYGARPDIRVRSHLLYGRKDQKDSA